MRFRASCLRVCIGILPVGICNRITGSTTTSKVLTDVKRNQRSGHRQKQSHQANTAIQRSPRGGSHHALSRPVSLADPTIAMTAAAASISTLGQSTGIQVSGGHIQKGKEIQTPIDKSGGRPQSGQLRGALSALGGAQTDERGIHQREEGTGDPQRQAGEVESNESTRGGRRRRGERGGSGAERREMGDGGRRSEGRAEDGTTVCFGVGKEGGGVAAWYAGEGVAGFGEECGEEEDPFGDRHGVVL